MKFGWEDQTAEPKEFGNGWADLKMGSNFGKGKGAAQPQQEVLLVVFIQVGMALVSQMTQAMRIALQS